jgi:hypothetical protein
MSHSPCDNTFSADSCVLCGGAFSADTGEKVTVGAKGCKTLYDFCIVRNASGLKSYLDGKPSVVFVHASCRKAFTNPSRKSEQFDTPSSQENLCEQPKKKLRSMSSAFNWHVDCLFCSKFVAGGEKSHSAMTLQIKETVEKKCLERDDDWARQVLGRVCACADFPSYEAVYHGQCQINFYTGRQVPGTSSSGAGRPVQDSMRDVFEVVCRRLQEDAGEEIHSVSELRDWMVELSDGDELVYSVKWIKKLLISKFGDNVFFSHVQGKNDVICFKDVAVCIINDKWYQERKVDVGDESQRIVVAAARLLKDSIRRQHFDTDVYPEPSDVGDLSKCKTWLPTLLRIFVDELFADEVKQVSLGQSIVQSVKLRAVISPVLLGVGLELDLKFRSKWLVDHLYRLGFSVSYDEVLRYRQSAFASNNEGPLLPCYPECFTQWVADNVDHNPVTLDGQGTFHGMGIIAASTPTSRETPAMVATRVKRIARMRVADLTSNRGVPLLTYCSPSRSGLCSVSFTSVLALLSPLTLPGYVNFNVLWRCAFFDSGDMHRNPSWSGYMQHVCTGEHSLPAHITFLPIIDLNPSDEHCLYSTLCFIAKQGEKLNIVNPCVTFDAPLWLKAQEILHASGLGKTLVCRLGGFHTMMSFLGSVGTLMAGSGLQEAMEVCYGPNAVIHMMSGVCVCVWEVSWHRLLE